MTKQQAFSLKVGTRVRWETHGGFGTVHSTKYGQVSVSWDNGQHGVYVGDQVYDLHLLDAPKTDLDKAADAVTKLPRFEGAMHTFESAVEGWVLKHKLGEDHPMEVAGVQFRFKLGSGSQVVNLRTSEVRKLFKALCRMELF